MIMYFEVFSRDSMQGQMISPFGGLAEKIILFVVFSRAATMNTRFCGFGQRENTSQLLTNYYT